MEAEFHLVDVIDEIKNFEPVNHRFKLHDDLPDANECGHIELTFQALSPEAYKEKQMERANEIKRKNMFLNRLKADSMIKMKIIQAHFLVEEAAGELIGGKKNDPFIRFLYQEKVYACQKKE